MKKMLLAALTVMMTATFGAKAEEPTVLLDTDFSVFSEGTMESPVAIKYNSDFTSKVPGYYMVSGLSQAGGCILIGPSGYIQTGYLSGFTFPTGGGTVRITAEVKMTDDYGGCIAYTPGYSSAINEIVEGNEWKTVVTLVPGVSSTTRIKIAPFLSVNGFYIKSLKIEASNNFIAAPEAYLPTDADGRNFTASCSVVSGGSKYEADVFSLDKDGNPVYFVQDLELKKLTAYSNYADARVTGLDPNTTYYYVARAIKDNGAKSENSNVIEVVKSISSIDAPTALPATNINGSSFTANWTAVENAIYYVVDVKKSTSLTADENVTVFAEDFSGVNVGTISSIAYSGKLNDFTKTPGWEYDLSYAFAAGYYVIYPSGGNEGYVTTPVIPLGANDGKFTVTVNAATGAFGTFKASGNTLKAELYNGDTLVETAPVATITTADFIDYTFEFTKGTADSRVKFTYDCTNDKNVKLYIDEINFTQNLKAGDTVQSVATSVTAITGTSINITIPDYDATARYSYVVTAVGQTVVGMGSSATVGEISSTESNEISISAQSGIDAVEVANQPLAWKVAAGLIGVNGNDVKIYDLSGHVLYSGNGAATIAVDAKGIVIVVVDNKAYKIAL